MEVKLPTFDSLMNPLIHALKELGGSGSIEEVYDKVVEGEKLPETITTVLHDSEKSNQTEVGYRLAWARTYLKKYGYLENSIRGIWSLTSKAKEVDMIDTSDVLRTVRELDRKEKEGRGPREPKKKMDDAASGEIPEESMEWKEKLYFILTQKIDPSAFERLVQRLLRESGFIQVEITGRTGDGGIDGKGIARINGFMSFHIFFQCKKWKGTVGSSEIRDFRGAMVGRADKGLFITTGTFSASAVKEAVREGAPPIDLIDGDQLAEKLKEFGLGVQKEMVEKVVVDANWFERI